MTKILLIFVLAYLAGSVNFAIIFFRLAGKADPRLSFSGNAGTTNVYRQAGLVWAAIIFLLDIGRAITIAALAVYLLPVYYITWTGFFLVLGNSFPCFHNFSGGKGVANYLGFSIFVTPWLAFFATFSWVTSYWIYHIPFIASFFMVFTLAIGQSFFFSWTIGAISGSTATLLLILFNHKNNIIELWKSNTK